MDSITYTISKIASIIGEKAQLKTPETIIQTLLFDNRKMADAEASLFFVLPGRVDGHHFVKDSYDSGLRNFVIYDQAFPIAEFPEANFIVTKNSLAALQKLASHHRSNFHYPVIGITGSNGKTIVKEWLFQLLSHRYHIVRSPKSFNSQLGVPISVWQMNNSFDLGIFEAGISQPEEMQNLWEIIRPTIGILTNIGSAHDEHFSSIEEKINEKIQLFSIANFVICNESLSQYIKNQGAAIFTWSFTSSADLQVTSAVSENKYTLIKAIYQEKEVHTRIPFTDKASIENAVICWATLLSLKIEQDIIAQRMRKLQAVRMRLELKTGKNDCSIIDDTYNSDLSSLEIALDFLNQQHQHTHKALILSDMYQTGMEPEVLYKKVAQLLKTKNIHRMVGVGADISKYKSLFPADSRFYVHTHDVISDLEKLHFNNEAILIKGARDFRFEKVSKLLSQKVHETVLEINLNALENNLNYYKSLLKPNVMIMAVVKAFSYGSGSYQIANLLQYNKVGYLAVAFADEGTELRNTGITLPIMVMSPEVSAFDAIIENNLEPELYSFRILKAFADYLLHKNIYTYNIHLKLDTGMHRLGFEGKEIAELIHCLKRYPQLRVKSAFSHLVASEDASQDEFTQLQISLFKDFTDRIESKIGYTFLRHLANTSAISRFKDAQFDMVRLGIGLYGIGGNDFKNDLLENVLTLKTNISQIKHLRKGETVGYGRKGVMPADGKIATLKIGYADGISRQLGNGVGKVLLKNKIVATIGSICMDMCMLDITEVDAIEGDEVIIFGDRQSIYNLAETLNTIPYEILTNISQRVKRVYYYA